jgi:hypothetical protein
MNRRLIALSMGALLTLSAGAARAQGPGIGTPLVAGANSSTSRVGTRGANFLEVGLGARGVGMAGAYSALAEGYDAMWWNLAGTAEVEGIAGGVNYSSLYGSDGITFVSGGVLAPFAGGGVGLQIAQMSSGNMLRTTYAFPDGGDPVVGGTFSYTGTEIGLSYARRMTDRLNVGVGLKYATEGISNASASYYGADFGIRFRTGLYGTTLGAALSNVGSSGQWSGSLLEANTFNTFAPGVVRVDYNTESYEMPTSFRFSVMSDIMGGPEALMTQDASRGTLKAVAEFTNAIDTDLQTALGLEYGWKNMLFIRGGRRWLNESNKVLTRSQYWNRGTAFGAGIRLPVNGRHVQFDYAWQGAGELPANNHFTFQFGF